MWTLDQKKKEEDVCVPCEFSLMVTSVEENFNKKMDRRTHSVCISYPLSPTALSLPSGLMNEVVMVTVKEVMQWLSCVDFYSSMLVWPQLLLGAQSASSRDQPWVLHMTPVPGVIIQLNGGRSILLDYVHHGRVIFCSYWDRHSRYGFVFPAHSASAQTTNCRLSKCFIHIMVFHTASLLIKKPTSQEMN